jgi:hypothetical protein
VVFVGPAARSFTPAYPTARTLTRQFGPVDLFASLYDFAADAPALADVGPRPDVLVIAAAAGVEAESLAWLAHDAAVAEIPTFVLDGNQLTPIELLVGRILTGQLDPDADRLDGLGATTAALMPAAGIPEKLGGDGGQRAMHYGHSSSPGRSTITRA